MLGILIVLEVPAPLAPPRQPKKLRCNLTLVSAISTTPCGNKEKKEELIFNRIDATQRTNI